MSRRGNYHIGANTLRGGKNHYGAKTLCANYVEDRKNPSFLRSAGASVVSDPRFMTTSAVQQDDVGGARASKYGQQLPPESKGPASIDYDNVINYDSTRGSNSWKSVGRSTYGKKEQSEFKTAYKGRGAHNQEMLDEYRGRWTKETDVMRKQRYCTEQTLMQAKAVPSAFTATVLRDLPGEPKIVERVRSEVLSSGRGTGLRGLAKMLKIMDDSGDGVLSKEELKWGLGDYGIDLTNEELDELFTAFDRDRSGTINFNEFLYVMRGPMNTRRLNLVGMAFDVIDKTGDGQVDVNDLTKAYDTSKHPDFISGKKTHNQIIGEFMQQWDGQTGKDGIVTKVEWAEYYRDVSASIDDDDYFELMIRNAWHISGGEGWCENTSNLRVLVKHTDGSMTVEEVKDDLGLKPQSETYKDDIKARLNRQGITDIAEIKLNA